MNFRFDEAQLALQQAVRSFSLGRADLRGVAGREARPADPALWSALAELGVLGILVPDEERETAIVEATIVFEVLGGHLITGPVLWSALAAPFVAGVEDGSVRVTGLDLRRGSSAPFVVDHAAESDVLLVVRADSVELVALTGLAGISEGAHFDPLTPTGVLAAEPTGQTVGDVRLVERIELLGTLLSAASLVGVGQGALDVARAYALERVQFGRSIGSFQAIKHILADMYVRVELARTATYAAAATLAVHTDGDVVSSVSAAKLLAGEAGIGNGRAAIQVLGGMGFTWDMLPHYFLKRAWVLEESFGTASVHARSLGAAVVDTARFAGR